jgi:hypothetical protein
MYTLVLYMNQSLVETVETSEDSLEGNSLPVLGYDIQPYSHTALLLPNG